MKNQETFSVNKMYIYIYIYKTDNRMLIPQLECIRMKVST